MTRKPHPGRRRRRPRAQPASSAHAAARGSAAHGVEPWREVREDKLARARALLRKPDYPGEKVLQSIARLLARHLQGPGGERRLREPSP
jgi:hypothetical protein